MTQAYQISNLPPLRDLSYTGFNAYYSHFFTQGAERYPLGVKTPVNGSYLASWDEVL